METCSTWLSAKRFHQLGGQSFLGLHGKALFVAEVDGELLAVVGQALGGVNGGVQAGLLLGDGRNGGLVDVAGIRVGGDGAAGELDVHLHAENHGENQDKGDDRQGDGIKDLTMTEKVQVPFLFHYRSPP